MLTGAILAAHFIWYYNIPAAETYIETWAVSAIMEFGVLWYYPTLNLPLLPVDKIMAGEFEWALLNNEIVGDYVNNDLANVVQTVIPKGLSWCKAYELKGMDSPWTLFNDNIKVPAQLDNCENHPITGDDDLGAISGCNYMERAGSNCYFTNLDQTERDWCSCAYETPGREKWGLTDAEILSFMPSSGGGGGAAADNIDFGDL